MAVISTRKILPRQNGMMHLSEKYDEHLVKAGAGARNKTKIYRVTLCRKAVSLGLDNRIIDD